MEKRVVGFFAILIATLPVIFVVWSHSKYWPEAFQKYTDVYTPQGPTTTFSDFSPSDRTLALRTQGSGVSIRPIIGSPTYLLFKPRRLSTTIRVELRARGLENVQIGYRTGQTVETNVLVPTEKNGDIFVARLPVANMFVEALGARRIVVHAPGAGLESELLAEQVRIIYED